MTFPLCGADTWEYDRKGLGDKGCTFPPRLALGTGRRNQRCCRFFKPFFVSCARGVMSHVRVHLLAVCAPARWKPCQRLVVSSLSLVREGVPCVLATHERPFFLASECR